MRSATSCKALLSRTPPGRPGGPRIYFQRVPEPKAVKNRLHLDVNAGGPPGTPPSDRRKRVDETVERLAASGATLVTASTEYDEYCVTMLDPEGNEFDVQ